MRVSRIVGVVLFVVVCPAVVLGGSDYSDKDFAVRFPPAFIRLREVSAQGGETAANRWSSAINPASADWLKIPITLGVLAPYYNYIGFDSGNRIHLIAESATVQLEGIGTLQPTLSQIHSNGDVDNTGLTFDFDVDTAQLLWAKRWGDWAFGAVFNFATAKTTREMGPIRVADATAESYRFRFGVLHECTPGWLGGLVFEYGFAPTRSTALVPTPMGFIPMKTEDTQHQFILRPGISHEYAEMSTIYADYQYGAYFNDDDTLHSHRFNAGVEHRVLEWLFVRVEGSVDTRGNMGWSAGLGAHLGEYLSVDLGYHYDIFPELRPEFGRSDSVQVVVAIRV